MSIDKETQKLQSILKIPVSAVALMGAYAQVFSDKEFIGTLPITKTAGDIVVYDSDERNLLNLNWSKVFEKSKHQLQALVADDLKNIDLTLVPATFRKVYVKDKENKDIAYFECAYENEKWRVFELKRN